MIEDAVTARLAEFAVQSVAPVETRHAGRRTLLNTVALATGASDHPAVGVLRDVLAGYGGAPTASLLGRPDGLPAVWAASVNGTAAHVEDFDDTHLPTMLHPGASVVPAALAAGELASADAGEVLDAVCVGVEVAIRIGRGVAPAHFERGWHPSGTLGHLGAAAAAGRVLGLNVDEMRTALGLAGTQAAGLLAALGTMTKPLHLGKAAGNGLEAALLARGGFTGPTSIVEGRRGFGEVAGPLPDYDAMLADLDSSWELEHNAFKPFACGIVGHPALEAARTLHERYPDITWSHLELRVHPMVLDVMKVEQPRNGLESKFSVNHCVAVGLTGGAGGPESFTDDLATDPSMAALRGLVRVEADDRIDGDGTALAGETTVGERHEVLIDHAIGSRHRPMDDEALARKATMVVEPVLGVNGAAALIEAVWSIGDVPSRITDVLERSRQG